MDSKSIGFLLARPPSHTSAENVHGLARAALDAGLGIPKDVALIGVSNLASLLVIDGGGQQAFSALGPPAPGLTVVLTTYNETTRIAEGTFTGTVNKGGGGTAVITGGTFKATIL